VICYAKTTVYELLDFWHVPKKLAPAAPQGAEVLAQWRLDLPQPKDRAG
jgi:hypothetical protein